MLGLQKASLTFAQKSIVFDIFILLQDITAPIHDSYTLFSCRMVNFCSKHLGLLAHQVVGEERLSFFSALLGNSWQQLIPGVDNISHLPVDITQLVILDLDSAWYF